MSSQAPAGAAADEAGFTLIEMIVALALLALVSGLLAGSVRSTRTILAAIERFNTASAVLPAQTYLRSALAQTVPARANALIGDTSPGLVGETDRVRFKTFYAPKGQLEGLYQIEVGLEPMAGRAGAYDLVVIQTLQRLAPADGAPAPVPSLKSTLTSDVASVSFRYFGASDSDPLDLQWLERWSSAERLPRMVEVGVTFAGTKPPWQRLEFPLLLAE